MEVWRSRGVLQACRRVGIEAGCERVDLEEAGCRRVDVEVRRAAGVLPLRGLEVRCRHEALDA